MIVLETTQGPSVLLAECTNHDTRRTPDIWISGVDNYLVQLLVYLPPGRFYADHARSNIYRDNEEKRMEANKNLFGSNYPT